MSELSRAEWARVGPTTGHTVVNALVTVFGLIGGIFFAGLLASFVLMHLAHGASGIGAVVYGLMIVWTLGFGICGLLLASYASWQAWQRRQPPFWYGW